MNINIAYTIIHQKIKKKNEKTDAIKNLNYALLVRTKRCK